MRILFVQHNSFLNGHGGTEKICSFLANGFSAHGHEVIIAVNQKEGGEAIFPLNPKVQIDNIYSSTVPQIEFNLPSKYNGNNPLRWLISRVKRKYQKVQLAKRRKSLQMNEEEIYLHNLMHRSRQWSSYIKSVHADLIISMSLSSFLEISYAEKPVVPVINSVNGRPDYDFENSVCYHPEYEVRVLRESFKKLTACQVLFDSYHSFLPAEFKGLSKTIGNPIPQYKRSECIDPLQEKSGYTIVNLARLDISCKQQDVAIDTFGSLYKKFSKWNLSFWGVGQDESRLKQKIQDLGLEDRVFLKGFTNSPDQVMKQADIFLFPSKYEGFGLALGEAMALGIPSVGFATCSGVNELISDSVSGFLANDNEDMANKLEMLMRSAELRMEIGANGREAMKEFDSNVIINKWLAFVEELVEKREDD